MLAASYGCLGQRQVGGSIWLCVVHWHAACPLFGVNVVYPHMPCYQPTPHSLVPGVDVKCVHYVAPIQDMFIAKITYGETKVSC
jgi:hypothetical protein